ncbi:MAG: hypothetical protein IJ716_07050 [Lachnospiraceae bacterium]|nr:hypothetical protein [Lachnospiraceae bacterium]
MRILIRFVLILLILVIAKIVSVVAEARGKTTDAEVEQESGKHILVPQIGGLRFIEGFIVLVILVCLIAAVACVIIRVRGMSEDDSLFYLAGFFVFLGVMMLVTIVVCEKSAGKNYILYDEGGIELHTARETKRVAWEQIDSVQVQGNAFLVAMSNQQILINGNFTWRGAKQFVRFAKDRMNGIYSL